MSIHKLSAGSGYDYLTRQVAALDATERATSGRPPPTTSIVESLSLTPDMPPGYPREGCGNVWKQAQRAVDSPQLLK